ncbi:MAG: TonB-dependent receptor [Sphingomonadales bacterium]|nr:TonB-dependent receptor [Sphingomonadales bacterium]
MPVQSQKTWFKSIVDKTRPSLNVIAWGLLAYSAPVHADETIEEIVVEETRLAPRGDGRVSATVSFGADELDRSAKRNLDDFLRRLPSFSLYRRSGSLSAHPTSQGVTLRGLGPNGAGRALVLMDGVPFNDPFGGWVNWAALPVSKLGRVSVTKGASVGPWGSGAISGTIEMESQMADEAHADVEFSYGSFDTQDFRVTGGIVEGPTRLDIGGSYFNSDGFMIADADQRGPVDVSAALNQKTYFSRFSAELPGDILLTFRSNGFKEHRLNGLHESANTTVGWDNAFGLLRKATEERFGFEVHAYHQERQFESTFAKINDDRSEETPVLDQYDVPSSGRGFNAIVRFLTAGGGHVDAGVDARRNWAETNEKFRNLGEGFSRRREAGGTQKFLGGFVEGGYPISDATSLQAALRLDQWKTTGGHRNEFDIATSELLRADDIPDRKATNTSWRLGVSHKVSDVFSMSLSAAEGFRLPTINELYRPYRIGNDITEANPFLNPEKVQSLELGLNYRKNALNVEASLFRDRLKDGVGNVTVAYGPGFFPLGGYVPAGGVLRQRQNIDLIGVDGLDMRATYDVNDQVRLEAAWLHVNARVLKSVAEPDLVGKDLAQQPSDRMTFAVDYAPNNDWAVRFEARHVGETYEDDRNIRTLKGFWTFDTFVSHSLYKGFSVELRAENMLDARIEEGQTAAGFYRLGAPRAIHINLRAGF